MELTEVFNYQEYIDFMESKKVRFGKDRTYTLYDFITENEANEIYKKGITNLSFLNPTPKAIQDHFNFVNITLQYLRQKYPKDKYLESLENDENKQVERCSKNWYSAYEIEREIEPINYD